MSTIKLENPATITSSGRYMPTPATSSSFDDAQKFVSGLLGVASNVTGIGASITGIDPTSQSLIQAQLEVQKQMMLTSMISNVHKSKHETEMAPVRNIRVG